MKSIKEIADKYIREQYIDYGDLNGQAETQIRDAVIFGLTQGQLLAIDSVSGNLPCGDEIWLKANETSRCNFEEWFDSAFYDH